MVIPRPICRLLLAIACFAGLCATPAAAQCLLCGESAGDSTASGRSASGDEDGLTPLRINITADLDFSRLVAGDGGGSISIDPQSGRSRTSGDVSPLGGSAFSGRALVEGSPGATVRIDLPTQISLTSGSGGVARISDIVSTIPPRAQLGPDGRLEFAFGGRLELSGTADGDYRGRIQITVSYE